MPLNLPTFNRVQGSTRIDDCNSSDDSDFCPSMESGSLFSSSSGDSDSSSESDEQDSGDTPHVFYDGVVQPQPPSFDDFRKDEKELVRKAAER